MNDRTRGASRWGPPGALPFSTVNLVARRPKRRSPESSVSVSWQACSPVFCSVARCPFDSEHACQEPQEEVPRIVRFGLLANMFDFFLLCRPLPFQQQTCLPGAPRRSPQNRPFWLHGHHRTPKDIPRPPGESPRPPKQPPGVPKEHPWNPRGPPETTQAPLESSQGTPLDPKDHRKVPLSSLPPSSSLPLPCSCLPSSSLLPPFSRPSANFGQPLLANQSVHQPWRSLQGAGGTGRQPLRYIYYIYYVHTVYIYIYTAGMPTMY